MNHKQFTNLRKVLEDKGVNFDLPIMAAIDRDIEQNIKGQVNYNGSRKEEIQDELYKKREYEKSLVDKMRSMRIIK